MTNIELDLHEVLKKEEGFTFGELYEFMKEEIERYEEYGNLPGLMDSRVTLDLLDKGGNILSGTMNFTAGYLIGDEFNLCGQLESLFIQKTKSIELAEEVKPITVLEYVIEVVKNSAKFRIMNELTEIRIILDELQLVLDVDIDTPINREIKDYIEEVFLEDYNHHYEHVKGVINFENSL